MTRKPRQHLYLIHDIYERYGAVKVYDEYLEEWQNKPKLSHVLAAGISLWMLQIAQIGHTGHYPQPVRPASPVNASND